LEIVNGPTESAETWAKRQPRRRTERYQPRSWGHWQAGAAREPETLKDDPDITRG
jgi:hypothetical protein